MREKEKLIATMGAHPRAISYGIGLVIAAILIVGLASASLIPIQQASAAPGSPGTANGDPDPNGNAINRGTAHAFTKTPANEPCSVYC